MNPRVAVLSDEFTKMRAAVDTLDQLCADEKRDLSDDERAEYDANLTRMEAIEADIERINTRAVKFDAVAAVTASINTSTAPARTNPRPELPSFGEQLMVRALQDDLGNVRRILGRDADLYDEHAETLTRALQHGVSADGTSPTTIEGDLIKFVDARRPAVDSVRRLPIPDNRSRTFERPKFGVTTQVGEQAAEGDVLASRRVTTDTTTVTKRTFGGTYASTEQAIDWTQPELLGLYVQDIAEQYAIETDDFLTDAIDAAAYKLATPNPLGDASVANFIESVTASQSTVYSGSKSMGDTLFVAPDRFFYIASLTGTDGRPVFPLLNPSQAAGSNPSGVTSFGGLNVLGLNVVVDPNFEEGFWAVAATRYIEFYENNRGFLQVEAPSTLETIYAYRGYVAVNLYDVAIEGLSVV